MERNFLLWFGSFGNCYNFCKIVGVLGMTKIHLEYHQKFYDDFTGYMVHQYFIPGFVGCVINLPVEISFPVDCVITFDGKEGKEKNEL